jgi:hypothetical protein
MASRVTFVQAFKAAIAPLSLGQSIAHAFGAFAQVSNSSTAVGKVESDPVGGMVPCGFRPSGFVCPTVGVRVGSGPRGEATEGGMKERRAAINAVYLHRNAPEEVAKAARVVLMALDALESAMAEWYASAPEPAAAPAPAPEPEPVAEPVAAPAPVRVRSRSRVRK